MTVTHKTNRFERTLVSTMAGAALALLFSAGQGVAAENAPSAVKSAGASSQPVRAKRVAKKDKILLAKAAPQTLLPQTALPSAVPMAATASVSPATAVAEPQVAATVPPVDSPPQVNPYLANRVPQGVAEAGVPVAIPMPAVTGASPSLPRLPIFEQSILPKIQTVYPTGEKPLVVVTFKCPTELVGIDTPSTLILHKVVNGGMDVINKTNLLSFNMQQVCQ